MPRACSSRRPARRSSCTHAWCCSNSRSCTPACALTPKGLRGASELQANSTVTNTFLADALSSFLIDNPDVDIELEEHPSREVIAAVAKGAADLGIVAINVEADELDVQPLYDDELIVIAHPDDPITRHESRRLADMLDTCRFVGLNHFDSVQAFLDRIAHGMGKRVNRRVQVSSIDAVCRMVEAGTGVAIMPRVCARGYAHSDNLRFLRLQDSWARREISLVRQRGRCPGLERRWCSTWSTSQRGSCRSAPRNAPEQDAQTGVNHPPSSGTSPRTVSK